MNCHEIQSKLGLLLDCELCSEDRDAIELHLNTCTHCRTEWNQLRALTDRIKMLPPVIVPAGLWPAIEQKLDSHEVKVSTPMRISWGRPALAASILLMVGAGLLTTLWQTSSSRAQAATIDFSVLLDELQFDAKRAFGTFLEHYHGREIAPSQAKSAAPELNFELPSSLPPEYQLHEVYVLEFNHHQGIAALYIKKHSQEFMAVIFHKPVRKEDFGTHKDYDCVVGTHHGHKVEVGEWSMVHLTDPTTCHCVLSTLDPHTELPPILSLIAPLPPSDH